jgi:hypothetical protein
MKSQSDIEELLSATPCPRVVVGPHRAYLKKRLFGSMQKEDPTMVRKTTTWRTGLIACGIAILLTAGGWAAYDCCFRFFVVEERAGERVVNPDGSVSQEYTAVGAASNDPDFTQHDANQTWQQIKAAIESGDYSLVKIKENESGPPTFIYSVVLEDGKTVGYGTSVRLPEPEGD